MVSLSELLPRARVVSLPLAARFRGLDAREAVLIEGAERWTEWSPFPEYGDPEAAVWLAAALDYGFSGSLVLPEAGEVPVNATVPAVAPEAVPAVLERFGPCAAVKVKVAEPGRSLADDVARVGAVRETVGGDALLRVDANGAWSLEEAERALRALAPMELDYAEQPVASVEELAELRRRLDGLVPIAADESIRKAQDPLRVAALGAADRIIVKAQPLGGIERACEIVRASGLPATVSSALDTSVGIAMGAQLAARIAAELGEPPAPAGLGTAALFTDDVALEPRRPRDGAVSLSDVTPDPDALDRLAASTERTAWWLARLERCLPLAVPTQRA